MPDGPQFELGWEEWLALPDLGLPAIKAKIDTGAKTSALHASVIEPFGPMTSPQVRFLIQPDPNNPALEVTCSAPVVDRREVTSSNGETELRYVIETDVEMGGRRWPIQLTLTNRESMTYRMLFGRGAMQPDMVVDPNESFHMPELSYKLYKGLPKKKPVKRPLRIALLTREPNNYSSRRLVEAARKRGHVIEMIDTARCYMQIGTLDPQVHYDGQALPRYDAVIPRIGAKITDYGMAVLRQFSNTGAVCLNEAGAIGRSRDKLLAQQLLARAKIAMPVTAFAHSPKDTKDLIGLVDGAPVVLKLLTSTQGRGVVLAETRKAAESLVDAFRGLDANFLVQEFVEEAAGADVRAFVIGNKVVGAMKRQAQKGEFRSNLHRGGTASSVRLTADERETARAAAKVLGLSVAGVDLLQTKDGPKVLEVNSSPGLEGIENASGKDIAGQIIEHLERQVRPLSSDRETTLRSNRRINVN
ncbi:MULTISPECIES: 30S ribosomal protein S6--L-glutamate ligase [Hyphomonas]|uniref:Probable alpha-L-glutamate ligase n=1 Tax=Hyphomonas adhaerens TaxID=81029 RepID=A0A3B9GUP4_9PROT|nr:MULTISPECIES: 30S ribosomal protein S6--L-glutamate ligase [Hyphomonas]MBB39819.1 30S ribosomal protein S6--L-glutamate ligase [Hyphomonas sp.]HAE26169.1 30S ribosomal protein S6--L-glutamate ligase [Hyphomonas adhaerens]|tara:strand:+ start:5933 stop:7351 length:1419 start_codon:yes stop_codon:yes gene_type:complete